MADDPTTPAERARLLALCDEAPQGRWTDDGCSVRMGGAGLSLLCEGRDDARYVAAWADPDTCRAYIAAAEERDALRDCSGETRVALAITARARDAARAILAEVEAERDALREQVAELKRVRSDAEGHP